MTLAERIDHVLGTHHAFLRAHLDPLDEDLRAANVPASVLGPWSELVAMLEDHLWKEESLLFPAVRRALDGAPGARVGFDGPLAQMAYEHEVIDGIVATLRAALDQAGALGPRLAWVLDDLETHHRFEDEQIFPAIAELGATS